MSTELVEELYEGFRKKVIHPTASPEQVRDMRMSFITGMWVGWEAVKSATVDCTDEEGCANIDALDKALTEAMDALLVETEAAAAAAVAQPQPSTSGMEVIEASGDEIRAAKVAIATLLPRLKEVLRQSKEKMPGGWGVIAVGVEKEGGEGYLGGRFTADDFLRFLSILVAS